MTTINNCARVCIVHENTLLLVSNDGSYWHLPGGHMEPQEGLAACAKREVYEETGYRVTIKDILYISEFYDKRIDSHKVECIFLGCIDTHAASAWKDLGEDKSVTMRRWFSLEETQVRTDIQPQFLKEGKWLERTPEKVYQGYEESK